MFHAPSHLHNVSLQLASVLEDIGINERIVLKRREACLLNETLSTIVYRLTDLDFDVFMFGSQSEGTTTLGLDSDADCLFSFNNTNVLQYWGEWTPGVKNLLMLQEEISPPGYCMLQALYSDQPLPIMEVPNDDYALLRGDKVIMNNRHINKSMTERQIRNGPSGSVRERVGYKATDNVIAFPCKSILLTVQQWLNEQVLNGKLSPDIIRYIQSSKCYVVPVGSSDSEFKDYEWRTSTSHVERCLMFNLNITQLQCYVLLKLILKTYLKSSRYNSPSSFMCKNILLLFIQNTQCDIWRPDNLLALFELCMLKLQESIHYGCCPHFILKHNLMRNKFSAEDKRWLLGRIQQVIDLRGCAFLGVTIDELGCRFQMKLGVVHSAMNNITSAEDISRMISENITLEVAHGVSDAHCFVMFLFIFRSVEVHEGASELTKIYRRGSCLEQTASCLLTPLICSTLGTMKASNNIYMNRTVSPEALTWLSLGLDSDVASSRLKLASVYYCVGDWNSADIVFRTISEKYNLDVVEAVCACYELPKYRRSTFNEYSYNHNLMSFKDICAICVKYLPSEIHCVPHELQYEMFRSTPEDLTNRGSRDYWMDWAVVDCIPYLCFLQYKTYGHLQIYDDQQEALKNLIRITFTGWNLGHRETALNLLGQCMEQESRHTEALHCYKLSLRIRPRNNVAKVHICRLLNSLLRPR